MMNMVAGLLGSFLIFFATAIPTQAATISATFNIGGGDVNGPGKIFEEIGIPIASTGSLSVTLDTVADDSQNFPGVDSSYYYYDTMVLTLGDVAVSINVVPSSQNAALLVIDRETAPSPAGLDQFLIYNALIANDIGPNGVKIGRIQVETEGFNQWSTTALPSIDQLNLLGGSGGMNLFNTQGQSSTLIFRDVVWSDIPPAAVIPLPSAGVALATAFVFLGASARLSKRRIVS